MSLLEVRKVGRRYSGVRAVHDVSFNVDAGEWVGVIGPNGAGKSTLFNTLGGQVTASSGKVIYDGRDITTMAPHRRYAAGINRSFQISSLFPELTVREHLALATRQHHRWNLVRGWASDRTVRARIEAVVEHWDLTEVARGPHGGMRPDDMSYGEQRRLELAIAVCSRPRLLLLDEPNVGLTVDECDDLRARLLELGESTAVIFVAHDMDMIMGWSHRILVMHQGELVADDEPEAIMKNPFVEEVYLGVAQS